jgi:hypothetical protein
MPETTKTQLAVTQNEVKLMKEQNTSDHNEIKRILDTLSEKLDKVIQAKADKSELKITNNRLWGFIVTTFFTLVGFVIYMIKMSI